VEGGHRRVGAVGADSVGTEAEKGAEVVRLLRKEDTGGGVRERGVDTIPEGSYREECRGGADPVGAEAKNGAEVVRLLCREDTGEVRVHKG